MYNTSFKPKTHQTCANWEHPTPLVDDINNALPYPIEAFPSNLQDIITKYHQYGKQPIPLIAGSLLANISLACQSMANVARDKYLKSPVSLYFLMVANSGERKSAIDNLFSKPVRSWEKSFRRKRESEVKTAMTLHHAWQMERDGLLSQIKRCSFSGEDAEHLKFQLAFLVDQEPEIPLLPTLYFEDATQEALAVHLANGWPSASLWSDEAGIVLGSHSMQSNPTRFVALLNRLWDGKTFTAHRKTSQSFMIQNRRLTLNLMMQPLLLQQLSSQATGIHRQSGFLARCLMAYPKSSMGNRFYQEPPKDFGYLESLENRLQDCLNVSKQLTQAGCINLPTLHMGADAKKHWIHFFNETESGVSDHGQWSNIKDFASKAPENAARLAALFHLYSGSEGDIRSEHMEQAIAIISWHLFETRRIFSIQSEKEEILEAQRLLDWLITHDKHQTTPREIQQFSPIRDKQARDEALELLANHNYIRINKQNQKTVVKLNPYAM
ncbi:YfjI family protein [Legionella impletisoli]|nr:YfjI family protein [Legionella impletisoli]